MTPIKLSKKEIVLLTKAYKETFEFIKKLANSEAYKSLPKFIKRPGIRSELSEGTIFHFMNEGLILKELRNPAINRNAADILAEDNNSNKIKIEIKGTGPWGFSQLSDKDIGADYLIWVNYGDFFDDDDKNTIDIYVLKDPIKSGVPAGKISINKFIGLAGKSLKLIEVNPIEFKVIRETTSIDKNMKLKRVKREKRANDE